MLVPAHQKDARLAEARALGPPRSCKLFGFVLLRCHLDRLHIERNAGNDVGNGSHFDLFLPAMLRGNLLTARELIALKHQGRLRVEAASVRVPKRWNRLRTLKDHLVLAGEHGIGGHLTEAVFGSKWARLTVMEVRE